MLTNKVVQDKKPPTQLARFLFSAFVCSLPVLFLLLILLFFCLSVASILFTSLLLFRSLSATFEQYEVSFEDRMTYFISILSSFFQMKFFVDLFKPLTSIYGFLSNILSHINFGRIAVQCQGSQAPIELLGNIILLITVFIVVEAEYAVVLLNLRELTGNYVRVSMLDRIFQGYRHYVHLLVSVGFYITFTEVNPVQITVQFMTTMVSIEQFYSFEYYGHSYSSYCNNYPGFTNIDSFMAYASTAVTTFFIIPLVVIMMRIMIPNKLVLQKNEAAARLDDDDEISYHPRVKIIIDFIAQKKQVISTFYLSLKSRANARVEQSLVFLRQLPLCVLIKDKLDYYESIRQKRYEMTILSMKSYLVPYAPRYNEFLVHYQMLSRVVKGVLSVLSADIAAVRIFMLWAASVFRSIENEQILGDANKASIVSEMDNRYYVSESTVRLTDSSREIIDRFSIVDANFWKFTGKFIDDDINHEAFKAEDGTRRLSFYELILMEYKEMPAASSVIRVLMKAPIQLIVLAIRNLFTIYIIVSCLYFAFYKVFVWASHLDDNYRADDDRAGVVNILKQPLLNLCIASFVMAAICDLMVIFLLKVRGITLLT